MSNALSSQAIKLLFSNVFYRAGNTTRRIFLNIYIFKFIGSLQILAFFSIAMLAFHLLGFFLTTIIIKKWYRNVMSLLSTWWMMFIFFLFSYNVDIIENNYAILAMFMWICSWAYWCVCNNNQFDLTIPKNRGNFEWWKKTLRTINAIITPALIGWLISLNLWSNSYSIAFLLWAIFFLFSAWFSIIDESLLPKHTSKFRFKRLLYEVAGHNNIMLMIMIVFLTWYALSTNIIEVIAPLVLTGVWLNEFWIWIFVSCASALSIISSYLFGKFVDYKYYKISYILAAIVYLLLISLVLLFPGQIFFFIFVTILVILYVFVDIPTTVFTSNYLHEIKDYKQLKSEYMLLREIASNISRILVFIPIFFMSDFTIRNLNFIFITMAFAVFISMILFMKVRIPNID